MAARSGQNLAAGKAGIVSISESQLAQLLEDKACGEFKVAVVQPARSSEEYVKDLENRSR